MIEPELHRARSRLERILHENIAPFWLPRVLDEQGGYRLHHGPDGEWLGPAPRQVVSQARMLWYCARMSRDDAAAPASARHLDAGGYLEAARHGHTFLWDSMWDQRHGGFNWEVAPDGRPLRENKHVLALGYGLFALSEYAAASGDIEAGERADTVFALLEERAHDEEFGGYREFFLPDWSAVIESGTPYFQNAISPKQLNTHLHLLEALSTYYVLRPQPLVRERLEELVRLLSTVTINHEAGAGTEWFRRDWSRLEGARGRRTSYGHDLERLWMLVEACDRIGLPHEPLLGLYRRLFDSSLRLGYDAKQGGFYEWGELGRPAFSRDKVWWVQAEALVAAATMYRLTGDTRYAQCFLDTLRWIEGRQVDWAGGDWFPTIEEDGRPFGDKAGPWREPYHHARAMLASLAMLPGTPG